MKNNDWMERKAVNCLEDIFLQNNLKYQLDTNDKTEHIDGHVYVENQIGQVLGINLGKIEIQVKGRTNSKKVSFKKGFMEYCKLSITPVVVVLVNINEDRSIEGVYYKYIDEAVYKDLNNVSYTVTFGEADRLISESVIRDFNNIQFTHWNRIVDNLSNVNTRIYNKNMYKFSNNVIRGVNGFIYTTLKQYMDTKFNSVARFALVYCPEGKKGISYSVIPIFNDNVSNDIIEVRDKKSMYMLGITRITSRSVEFTNTYVNKLISNILKEELIPSIIDKKIFCKINKEMAIRSITYHLNDLISLEWEKLSDPRYNKEIANYNENMKKAIVETPRIYGKTLINDIVNLNINIIKEKLNRDIEFFNSRHIKGEDYSFISECNNNKYRIDVVDGIYNIKLIQESRFFLIKELLIFIDDNDNIDLRQCYFINGHFDNIQEADNYVRLKYECICDFCNTYLCIQPTEYKWNTFLSDFIKGSATIKCQEYYCDKWKHGKDITISDNNDLEWKSGLKGMHSAVIGHSFKLKIKQEPLIEDIYEEILNIIFKEIDRYFIME